MFEHSTPRWRFIAGVAFAVALSVAFAKVLFSLALHGAANDLHSHTVLIPLISAYLIYIHRRELPRDYGSSPGLAAVGVLVGGAALAALFVLGRDSISHNDQLALTVFSLIAFSIAGGFAFLGRQWMKSAIFPVLFLLFMIPLPDRVVHFLEIASAFASAEVAAVLFAISGVPVLRDGLVFELPGIVLEVAQECSGIRSSWVLFITSILASRLFLVSPWRRLLLVFFVIPLGLLRNGVRILVIGLLCVHIGPEMIHSIIHKRGGPLFFALSLIPLCALLFWLRSRELRGKSPDRSA